MTLNGYVMVRDERFESGKVTSTGIIKAQRLVGEIFCSWWKCAVHIWDATLKKLTCNPKCCWCDNITWAEQRANKICIDMTQGFFLCAKTYKKMIDPSAIQKLPTCSRRTIHFTDTFAGFWFKECFCKHRKFSPQSSLSAPARKLLLRILRSIKDTKSSGDCSSNFNGVMSLETLPYASLLYLKSSLLRSRSI